MEEIEIKIEYTESFEIDPLFINKCRKKSASSKANLDIVPVNCGDTDQNATKCPSKSKLDVFKQESSHLAESSTTNSTLDDTINNEEIATDTANENGKYPCKFCNTVYQYIQTLRRHIKNKHPDKIEIMKQSALRIKRKPKIKCHLCKRIYDNLSLLKEHFKSHSIEDIKFHYKCNVLLENNEKTSKNNSTENFNCPYCDHISKSKYGIKRHILLKHEMDKKYSCPLCSYKATMRYYLEVHIASNHLETDIAKVKNKYFCDVCGYRTPKKSHFTKHTKLHTAISKTHECTFCNYSTHSPNNLKVHIRTHTKEKPYKCDVNNCEYSCISKTALNSHTVKHYPERYMLFCDKCNYKTVYRQSLRKHLEIHSK